MIEINKENLDHFLNYYHNLHDSYIINMNYDISNANVELLINVIWSGEPKLKEDNSYETNKTKIRIVFEKVEKIILREINSWDYINGIHMKYTKLDNKEFIYFTNDENDPDIFILCENIKYEE